MCCLEGKGVGTEMDTAVCGLADGVILLGENVRTAKINRLIGRWQED
jgi:hypothetical protein